MSLNSALLIGNSAIAASQAAMQVAGNNMANAATPGYSRQVASLVPLRPDQAGRNQFVGTGVALESINRVIDTALQARLRSAISEQSGADVDLRFLSAVETLQNELTENDLSTLLGSFFNAFSELANNPLDNAVRNVLVQEGVTVASRIQDLRGDYQTLREEIDRSLDVSIEQANGILDQIAGLNREITLTEQGQAEAGTLRDQRDRLVDELSELLDVTVIEQANGAIDIHVGSLPIVLGAESRGLELRTRTEGDTLEVSLRVAADGSTLDPQAGAIGSLLRQREQTVQPAIELLDEFAGQLIVQVNNLHAQGQGLRGFEALSGTVSVADTSAALNADVNELPWTVGNGSFTVHMTHESSGARTSWVIPVNGDSQSVQDIVDLINTGVNVPNLDASIGLDSTVSLSADPGYRITFSDDSSGALAALGINGFFAGSDAGDIQVADHLAADPSLIAAGSGHVDGSNGTAIAIAGLQDAPLDAIDGRSLRELWQTGVNDVAVRTSTASGAAESAALVRESISAQMQAVSGVSLDEETVNLLAHQRQFQAAARFISAIDEVMQTLLSIV